MIIEILQATAKGSDAATYLGGGAGLVAAIWALVEVMKRMRSEKPITATVEQSKDCARDHERMESLLDALSRHGERQAIALEDINRALSSVIHNQKEIREDTARHRLADIMRQKKT
jgi:hypothetical protein